MHMNSSSNQRMFARFHSNENVLRRGIFVDFHSNINNNLHVSNQSILLGHTDDCFKTTFLYFFICFDGRVARFMHSLKMWMKIVELFSTPFRTQSRRCKIRQLLLCVVSSFNKRSQALTTFILVIASFLCQNRSS